MVLEPGNANNVLLSCLEKNVTKQASATATASLSSPSGQGGLAQRLQDAFITVRNETERRAAPLSPEDQQIQSMGIRVVLLSRRIAPGSPRRLGQT